MSIEVLKEQNAARWKEMRVLNELIYTIDNVAHRLCAESAKNRYLAVQQKTKVPWFIIAVIHEREASQSWAANLAQGDPWDRTSIHVPRGQGPFKSWEDAAVNALSRSPPFAARWEDWSVGGALTLLEMYNGLGYFDHHIPSPYIWASTNIYHKGKYIADGHFDPEAIDHQLGCAALISRMQLIDGDVEFDSSGA